MRFECIYYKVTQAEYLLLRSYLFVMQIQGDLSNKYSHKIIKRHWCLISHVNTEKARAGKRLSSAHTETNLRLHQTTAETQLYNLLQSVEQPLDLLSLCLLKDFACLLCAYVRRSSSTHSSCLQRA